MKKRMIEYNKYAESIVTKDLDPEERSLLRQNILIQIGFFQHERLIHLLVTLTFAILSMITLLCVLISDILVLPVLLLLLLFMLFPYVNHYFRLEWGVQKLYKYYDLLEDRSWTSKT